MDNLLNFHGCLSSTPQFQRPVLEDQVGVCEYYLQDHLGESPPEKCAAELTITARMLSISRAQKELKFHTSHHQSQQTLQAEPIKLPAHEAIAPHKDVPLE